MVFDAKGVELSGKYKFQKFSVLAGYNLYIPDLHKNENTSTPYRLDPGFKRSDIILGLSYHPFRFAQMYSEQRISMGKNSLGEREKSVFTLGLRIDISHPFNKKFDL